MVEFDDENEKPKPKKMKPRRGTKKPTSPDMDGKFLPWWEIPSVQFAFSHPKIRSRLEKLMGTNLVSLTDREYMLRLQKRILQDYAETMDKNIKAREVAEMERVKNLVLTGKIPLNAAPPEMSDHPIMMIEDYCNLLIQERRLNLKNTKVLIPKYLYLDDTPDPPSGLSIEKGHVFRKGDEKLCKSIEPNLASSDEEDIKKSYMFTDDEYERLKYQNPAIKELMNCETVEQMYALADEILGILKDIVEDADSMDIGDKRSVQSAIGLVD